MLTEQAKVRQGEGAARRRWFRSNTHDLIVWYAADGAISGFQLCYDRQRTERALTWIRGERYSHHKVDDGEDVGLAHKRTPILVADGIFDAAAELQRFIASSETLPQDVVAFVSSKVQEYANHTKNS